MIESNSIIFIMFLSFFAGLIANIISRNVGILIGFLSSFPLILFFIASMNSGLGLENISNLNSWITVFITNLIPLLISYVAEGAGASVGVKIKSRF